MNNLDVYIIGLLIVTVLMLIAFDRDWLTDCTDRLAHIEPSRRACLLVLVAIATGVLWPIVFVLCLLDLSCLIKRKYF